MQVHLLASAQVDLDEAIAWCAAQAPGLGEGFLVEFLRCIELIRHHPDGWHPLAPTIRRCRLRRFPYGVIYTVESGDVLVLTIAHQHRKPGDWQNRVN